MVIARRTIAPPPSWFDPILKPKEGKPPFEVVTVELEEANPYIFAANA